MQPAIRAACNNAKVIRICRMTESNVYGVTIISSVDKGKFSIGSEPVARILLSLSLYYFIEYQFTFHPV
jgi:hypothetical protein